MSEEIWYILTCLKDLFRSSLLQRERIGSYKTEGYTRLYTRFQESERKLERTRETENGRRKQKNYGVCEIATGERVGKIVKEKRERRLHG